MHLFNKNSIDFQYCLLCVFITFKYLTTILQIDDEECFTDICGINKIMNEDKVCSSS